MGMEVSNIQNKLNAALSRAVRESDIERIVTLAKKGADLNAPDEFGHMPLHYAAQYSADAVRALISQGARVNVRAKKDGSTPLHFAVFRLNQNAAVALVEGGADLYASDNNGVTPLRQKLSIHREIAHESLIKACLTTVPTYVLQLHVIQLRLQALAGHRTLFESYDREESEQRIIASAIRSLQKLQKGPLDTVALKKPDSMKKRCKNCLWTVWDIFAYYCGFYQGERFEIEKLPDVEQNESKKESSRLKKLIMHQKLKDATLEKISN